MDKRQRNIDQGKRIIEIIERLGIGSIRQFAISIGMDNSQLNKVINGDLGLPTSQAIKISEKYNIDLNWLLNGLDKKPNENIHNGNLSEAKQVPFDDFMEAKYLPAYAQAGYLSAYTDRDSDADQELDTILVPREFEKGNYLVIEVSGDSMDDDSKRAICAGDKLLIKELASDLWQRSKVHYRNAVFVLMTKTEGIVVKQIIKHNVDEGKFICHSWNPTFGDFPISVQDVLRLFYVKKIVERRI